MCTKECEETTYWDLFSMTKITRKINVKERKDSIEIDKIFKADLCIITAYQQNMFLNW